MKLSANIDLEGKRSEALSMIDATYTRLLVNRAAMAEVYELKEEIAGKVLNFHSLAPEWLELEAMSKGVDIFDLCRQILSKADETRDYAATIEASRQRAKDAARQAQSEQAIDLAIKQAQGTTP